jgi:class I fructose-bisphosphate aldolase
VNPPAYDPDYHIQLAIDAGCNGYAAPLGALEAVAGKYLGEIPLVLKLNNSEVLSKQTHPHSAVTGSVKDAVRLGCAAIGYTIYPGSGARNEMLGELRELLAEAKEAGLPTIVWAYARGTELSKEGETAADVISYSAHLAAQMGAHVIKVKPPTAHLEQSEAKKAYEKAGVSVATLSDRIRLVVQSAFNGKRIVIFSGGEPKDTAALLAEVKAIRDGGGFGSIMGRNVFQRPREESLKLLRDVISIFK